MTSEKTYPFDLVRHDHNGAIDHTHLFNRPFTVMGTSFLEDANRFIPGIDLETAINTAIAVGQPLLVTGEPGTGKTQTAYYAAYKLGIEPVIHFQVKSDSSAVDLLYHFDSVRYFYDASIAARKSKKNKQSEDANRAAREFEEINKSDYVEPRAFWEAIISPTPRVLLIDEIDKAPRDFPNDLLHELDKMEFTVIETRQVISAPKQRRPIVFITSNSERRLPEPFLRRCVYHHIRFERDIVDRAIMNRRDEYKNLSKEFIELAVSRFFALRELNLRKKPSTGELLVWLRVLSLATDASSPEELGEKLSSLPHLYVLLKDHQDLEEIGSK